MSVLGGPPRADAPSRQATEPRGRLGAQFGKRRVRWFTGDRLVAAALVLAVVTFIALRLGPSLVGTRVFLGLDALRLYEPWMSTSDRPVTSDYYVTDHLNWLIPALHEVHQRFVHGDWASWSNYTMGGSPLLVIPNLGVLSPGRWLYLFLPTWLAPSWSKLAELAFAATFMYLFVRRLKGSKLAAGLAGFVYPLTGFMIGWTNYPQVAVGSVIPMMFWAIERYVQQPRLRAVVPVAIASALLLFGGFPGVAGLTFYAAGGYATVRVIATCKDRIREVWVRFAFLAAAIALGAGVAAFQLLPFAHQVLGVADLTYRQQAFFSTSPHITGLFSILPQTFGSNVLCCGASPQDMNAYVGAVVLLLVMLGVVQAAAGRVQRSAGLYFVSIIAAVIILVWFQGWWSSWLDHLPVFHGNPIGRARSQLGLPVAALTAAGFDWMRGRRWNEGWWRRSPQESPALTSLMALVVCAIVGTAGLYLATRHYAWIPKSVGHDAILAGVPVALIAIGSFIAIRFKAVLPVLLVIVIGGVVAQAYAATSYFWPTAPRSEFYPNNPAIQYLQKNQGSDRIATMALDFRANAPGAYGLRTLNGQTGQGFMDPRFKSFMFAVDHSSLLGQTFTALTTNIAGLINSPGLDRMGVRYLVGGAEDTIYGTNTPVPIPGVVDALAPGGRLVTLRPNQIYRVQIPGGSLRGVNIPLTASRSTHLAVRLVAPDGSTLTSNARLVSPGASIIPVPLADDPAGPDRGSPSQRLSIELSVNTPGVTATVDAAGTLRLQTVRPPATPDGIRLAVAGSGLTVWERMKYVPRVHWATHATVISSDAGQLAATVQTPADPADVILAQSPPAPLGGAGSAPAQLDLTRDNGDNIDVTVRARSAGYLVIADRISTQFAARVDGRATPIVRADYLNGAIFVPAGAHRVAISYAPRGRTEGAAISIGSAAILLIALVPVGWWGFLRRRRPKTSRSQDSEISAETAGARQR